jgi:hypothetical protein
MNKFYTLNSNTSNQSGDKLQNNINDDHFDVSHTEYQPSQKAIDFILNFSKALDVKKTKAGDAFIIAN